MVLLDQTADDNPWHLAIYSLYVRKTFTEQDNIDYVESMTKKDFCSDNKFHASCRAYNKRCNNLTYVVFLSFLISHLMIYYDFRSIINIIFFYFYIIFINPVISHF